jgi:hypothetical protein
MAHPAAKSAKTAGIMYFMRHCVIGFFMSGLLLSPALFDGPCPRRDKGI